MNGEFGPDGLRIITDPDAEPEPLRSQLWALAEEGAAEVAELFPDEQETFFLADAKTDIQ